MNSRKGIFFSGLMVAVGLALLSGCEDKPMTLSYERPAQHELPEGVRRIAVAEFGGMNEEDRRYGDIASDMLASKLDALNKRYERFQLVDRKRLGEILAERDMQLAVADNTQAVQAGKLADVQAIIYGTVHVVSKDEQASRSRFDFASKRNVTEYYTKRYCSATVTFTMDDVRTSKTLVTISLMKEYDSEKNKDLFLSSLGAGDNGVSPSHQVIVDRIEQCVQEFVQKISPHSVEIVVKMEKGKSKAIGTGNKLARTGDYGEALEWYRRGLSEKPDDDGAMFNTGLVCEAQGNLKEAEQWYSKAFSVKDKEKYLQARTRVRQELVE